MYQALYRVYRPRTFDDVVGQAHITDTLKRQVEGERLSHAYLFTGTRGTGKTTCAKVLARAVNCEAPQNGNPCNTCPACLGIEDGSILDVLELDAASNNGVDHVRALRDEAVYTPAVVKKRVYIVDEVHMLSTAAFNALLKILEEPPAHLMFILATTELHKVPATIKSRCQQFAFKRILPAEIAARLGYVAECEGIDLTAAGAQLLARLADGGMRDALSLLDQCNLGGRLDESEILMALGMAGNLEVAGLMEELALGDTAAALTRFTRLYGAGKDVKTLMGELSGLCRDLLIRKTAPKSGSALLTGAVDETTARKLLDQLSAPRLLHMLCVLQAAAADLSRSTNQRTDAEICLIRLSDETMDGGALGLSARVARLESMAAQPVQMPAAAVSPAPPAAAAKGDVVPPIDDDPPWAPDIADDDPPWVAHTEPEAPQTEEEIPPPPTAAPASGETDVWADVLAGLRGKIAPGVWAFLSNPAMTTGTCAGGVLTLTANAPVTKSMIDKPEVLTQIAARAEGITGTPIRAEVRLKQDTPPGDNFDSLLAFEKRFQE